MIAVASWRDPDPRASIIDRMQTLFAEQREVVVSAVGRR
jgi:hypothetical protein